MNTFDNQILELLKCRPECYFGMADWENFSRQLKIKVKFPRIIQVPFLKDLDFQVGPHTTIGESLRAGEAFAFLVPPLPEIFCSLRDYAGFKRIPLQGIVPGVHVVDFSQNKRSRKSEEEPAAVLAGILFSLKDTDKHRQKQRLFILKTPENQVGCEGRVLNRILNGTFMPMQRLAI
ncbi:MAG TPA: hypothetical protein PKI61_00925 [bacterium]|nr:hypothetical protein [bacterium]HPT29354.1 hypothetical protein [bacterium]